MKKDELMKLEGMTDDLAAKILEMAKNDAVGMIPQSRLNEVIAERDNAKKDHAQTLTALESLKKDAGDVEGMKAQIQKMQDDAKAAQKTHDAEIHALKVDNAVESALMSAKALNTKAVKALLTGLDKAEFAEDGTVKGLADQIKALQTAENSKFLFGSVQKMKGAKFGESGNEDGDKGVDTSKMSYSEFLAYSADHPDATF